MKNWLIAIIIILLIALGVAVDYAYKVEGRWEKEAANVKAYDELLGEKEKKTAALELTVEQLEYFQDSVLKEMNEVRKELKIKDKRLKSLQQVKTVYQVSDTVVLRDTLFRDASLSMDTLLGNEWYSVGLSLRYPSTVAVTPEFKSEKYIVVSSRKETVNPPKKFFLWRWLQKKHLVLNVDVVEKNPYVQEEQSRFVEIIK